MSARVELYQRLRAVQQRQADLRELRAWIEGRVAARRELDQHGLAHDITFLRETQPIIDWLEAELAELEKSCT